MCVCVCVCVTLLITVLFIPSLACSKPEGTRLAVNLIIRGDVLVIVARNTSFICANK